MFGFIKKRPNYSPEEIFDLLGQVAQKIEKAPLAGTDLEVAMQGAAVVAGIVSPAKEHLNITLRRGSIFDTYLSAVERRDFNRMIDMIKNMAAALRQVHDVRQKGALIYFWFRGDE